MCGDERAGSKDTSELELTRAGAGVEFAAIARMEEEEEEEPSRFVDMLLAREGFVMPPPLPRSKPPRLGSKDGEE